MRSLRISKSSHWNISKNLFLVFVFSSFIACSQQNKLYNDLIGDYEYYLEGQHTPARVFIQNDTLMCDVGVGITLILEPVNIEELRFRSENEDSMFDIQFEREGEGKISRFIFTAGDVVIPGEL